MTAFLIGCVSPMCRCGVSQVTSSSASSSRLAEKLRASHYWGGATLQVWRGNAVQYLAPWLAGQTSRGGPAKLAIQAADETANTTRCVVFQGSWQLRSQARRPAWNPARSAGATPKAVGQLPFPAAGVNTAAGSKSTPGCVRSPPLRSSGRSAIAPQVGWTSVTNIIPTQGANDAI
jgi:hypothetical protein